MTSSFVPRPIYAVKPYGVKVQKNDTLSGIANRFPGIGLAGYRELAAANLFGRELLPMGVGCPCGSMTIGISEDEMLRVPSHWPDPPGLPAGLAGAGMVGDPTLDPIATAIAQLTQNVNSASGGAYTPDQLSSITNAAVQWFYNTQGTNAAPDPAAYLPLVTSAVSWMNTYGDGLLSQGVTPGQLASFPWAPFLAMLPAMPDLANTDWTNGVVPTTQIPWSSIPWGYLAQIGPTLEALPPPQVTWPSSTDPASILTAIQTAIATAQGQGGTATQPPSGQPCPTGATYDGGASPPGCFTCPPDQTYSMAAHTCVCPAGQTFDQSVGKCLPPPSSPSDCAQYGEVYDENGPVPGPHCYTCGAPWVYSATTHSCVCPAGQTMMPDNSCVPTASAPPSKTPPAKVCPQGSTPDASGNCTSTPAQPPAPTASNSMSTTAKVLAYAGAGVAVLALVGGGIYLATRPVSKKTTRAAREE